MPITPRAAALFSYLAYQDHLQLNDIPTGWQTIREDPVDSGFFARVLYQYNHPLQCQLVFSFRGTVISNVYDVLNDLQLATDSLPQQFSSQAIPLVSNITTTLPYSNCDIVFTGHSLGAAIAEFSSMEFHHPAITFDSPGTKMIAGQMLQNGIFLQNDLDYGAANIKEYLSQPDLVNTMAPHIGDIFRVDMPIPEVNQLELLPAVRFGTYTAYSLQYTHRMENMLNAFNDSTGQPYVKAKQVAPWPSGTSILDSTNTGYNWFSSYAHNPWYYEKGILHFESSTHWDDILPCQYQLTDRDCIRSQMSDLTLDPELTFTGDDGGHPFTSGTTYADTYHGGIGDDTYYLFGGDDEVTDNGGTNHYQLLPTPLGAVTINDAGPHDGSITIGQWRIGGTVVPQSSPTSLASAALITGAHTALVEEVVAGSFHSTDAFNVRLYPTPSNPANYLHLQNFRWGDFGIDYPQTAVTATYDSAQSVQVQNDNDFFRFQFRSVAYDTTQRAIIEFAKGHTSSSGSSQFMVDGALTYTLTPHGIASQNADTILSVGSLLDGNFPEYLSTPDGQLLLRIKNTLSNLRVMNDQLIQTSFSNDQINTGTSGFNAGYQISNHPQGLWYIQSFTPESQDYLRVSNDGRIAGLALTNLRPYHMSNKESYVLKNGNTFLVGGDSGLDIFSPELRLLHSTSIEGNIIQNLPVHPSNPQEHIATLIGGCNNSTDCTVKIFDINGQLQDSANPYPTGSVVQPVFYDSQNQHLVWLVQEESSAGMDLTLQRSLLNGEFISATSIAQCSAECHTYDTRLLANGMVKILWGDITQECTVSKTCSDPDSMKLTTVEYSTPTPPPTLLLGDLNTSSILDCSVDTNPAGCLAMARSSDSTLIGAIDHPFATTLSGAAGLSNNFVFKIFPNPKSHLSSQRKLLGTDISTMTVNNLGAEDSVDINNLLLANPQLLESTNYGNATAISFTTNSSSGQVMVYFASTAGPMFLSLTNGIIKALAIGNSSINWGQPSSLLINDGTANSGSLGGISGSGSGSEDSLGSGSGSGIPTFLGTPAPDSGDSPIGLIIGVISGLLVLLSAGAAWVYCSKKSLPPTDDDSAVHVVNPLELMDDSTAADTTVELVTIGQSTADAAVV